MNLSVFETPRRTSPRSPDVRIRKTRPSSRMWRCLRMFRRVIARMGARSDERSATNTRSRLSHASSRTASLRRRGVVGGGQRRSRSYRARAAPTDATRPGSAVFERRHALAGRCEYRHRRSRCAHCVSPTPKPVDAPVTWFKVSPAAPWKTQQIGYGKAMVVVHRAYGFRFVIYMSDHEPAHVHYRSGTSENQPAWTRRVATSGREHRHKTV
jgi:hypothetical protein